MARLYHDHKSLDLAARLLTRFYPGKAKERACRLDCDIIKAESDNGNMRTGEGWVPLPSLFKQKEGHLQRYKHKDRERPTPCSLVPSWVTLSNEDKAKDQDPLQGGVTLGAVFFELPSAPSDA